MMTFYFKEQSSEPLVVLPVYKPGSWVYVENPNEAELHKLAEQFHLDEDTIVDILDDYEMPRVERDNAITYFFMRFAYDQGGEVTTDPVLFILSADLFITITPRRFPQLERFTKKRLEYTTVNRTHLFLEIIDQIIDQYEWFITRTSKRIRIIRSRLRENRLNKEDLLDFVVLEDTLNEFLSALQPTAAILQRLLAGRHIKLFEDDRDTLEDGILSCRQSIEGSLSNIKTIVNIREAYSTLSSDDLNHTMKLLTAATIIVALPNVFFGMYGMNVGLPFSDSPWAYVGVLGLTLLTMGIVILFMRRKRLL
ncbi:hypothetical protein B7Z28_01400 [Candidatus Saccharibacteria bacterium 32-45-3]|nr:MAG: hypothetical protein B7Z28_01400 [Candidatus Saccharibacteria bacterium 32-45-3]